MALVTVTREEFDQRLEAANARRAQELQQMGNRQAKTKPLLSHSERTLSEIESLAYRMQTRSLGERR